MDEQSFLEYLEEYSGNWQDRQYREHMIREVQKMQHLSKLIGDHKHNPRDQLMLEASKRKTVTEIEKKFQSSQINAAFKFPRATTTAAPISKTPEEGDDSDNSHSSLDLDFYNLNAQNAQKKKKKKVINSIPTTEAPANNNNNNKSKIESSVDIQVKARNDHTSNNQQQQQVQSNINLSQEKSHNITGNTSIIQQKIESNKEFQKREEIAAANPIRTHHADDKYRLKTFDRDSIRKQQSNRTDETNEELETKSSNNSPVIKVIRNVPTSAQNPTTLPQSSHNNNNKDAIIQSKTFHKEVLLTDPVMNQNYSQKSTGIHKQPPVVETAKYEQSKQQQQQQQQTSTIPPISLHPLQARQILTTLENDVSSDPQIVYDSNHDVQLKKVQIGTNSNNPTTQTQFQQQQQQILSNEINYHSAGNPSHKQQITSQQAFSSNKQRKLVQQSTTSGSQNTASGSILSGTTTLSQRNIINSTLSNQNTIDNYNEGSDSIAIYMKDKNSNTLNNNNNNNNNNQQFQQGHYNGQYDTNTSDGMSTKTYNTNDSQRKGSNNQIRVKKTFNVLNSEDTERMSASTHMNSNNSLQFSQTNSNNPQKNKWIDFKKQNSSSKDPVERRTLVGASSNGNNQIDENNPGNARIPYNSISPNGHVGKKGQSQNNMNNYLSFNSTLTHIGSTSALNTMKGGQKQTSHHLIPQPQGLQGVGGGVGSSNSNSTLLGSAKQQIAAPRTNEILRNQSELSNYQVKSGRIISTENPANDKNYHQSFANNAKAYHSQQMQLSSAHDKHHGYNQQQQITDTSSYSLQRRLPAAAATEDDSSTQQQQQRKQMNKVSSCKTFEIRDKFGKISTKSSTNNANNVIINLSVGNNNHNNNSLSNNSLAMTAAAAQYLNNTTDGGNYNNQQQTQYQYQVPASMTQFTNASAIARNNLMNSQNAANYLPTPSLKNVSSTALYQKSQINILGKQGKIDPNAKNLTSIFNGNTSANSNQILLTTQQSQPLLSHQQQQQLQHQQIQRNSSLNAQNNSSSIPSAQHLNSNVYLGGGGGINSGLGGNSSNNAKLAKKIDMQKVFNSTNSNSLSAQMEYSSNSLSQIQMQSGSAAAVAAAAAAAAGHAKQGQNLGAVLSKIAKSKQQTRVDDKYTAPVYLASTPMANKYDPQSNSITSPLSPSHYAKKPVVSTQKKAISPTNANTTSTVKYGQFSSQIKSTSKVYL